MQIMVLPGKGKRGRLKNRVMYVVRVDMQAVGVMDEGAENR